MNRADNQPGSGFTWMPFFRELADELAGWRNRQPKLISFLESLREQGLTITSLRENKAGGGKGLMTELDPFTFIGVMNHGIKQEDRFAIARAFRGKFGLSATSPEDFAGVPLLAGLSARFVRDEYEREDDAVDNLWDVFQLAVKPGALKDEQFLASLDKAFRTRGVSINLTVGLFWIRPDAFVSLDSAMRDLLNIRLPGEGLTAAFYRDTVMGARSTGTPVHELSYRGRLDSGDARKKTPVSLDDEYVLVGAYWSDYDVPDRTSRFVEEGVWINGYEDRYLDNVKAVKVGTKIAIKSTSVVKHGLPFDAKGHTVSRMPIKARGTVIANRGDGRHLEVEWEPDYEPRDWYFFTHRTTFWRLRTDARYTHLEYSRRLISFIWGEEEQDYDWFVERWYEDETKTQAAPVEPEEDATEQPIAEPYSPETIIDEGAFLSLSTINELLDLMKRKKAVILQGPPGVGKTYLARRLAFALMEEKDPARVRLVQFHQSYGYDDFMQGYRPNPESGGFAVRDGVFYRFCNAARQDPERDYVFIIDEINRGNLSQILGEALMLLESDKRGKEFAVPLLYQRDGEADFYIPENIHVLGLMNLADRSLAMIDYGVPPFSWTCNCLS